ncbi:MAG: PepSY-associated TM helix domain-containing protein [Acidobacteriota bacterium]
MKCRSISINIPAICCKRSVVSADQTSIGDDVMKWLSALHTGSFGGSPVRVLWAIFGLSFPLLAITGILIWWNRPRRE